MYYSLIKQVIFFESPIYLCIIHERNHIFVDIYLTFIDENHLTVKISCLKKKQQQHLKKKKSFVNAVEPV